MARAAELREWNAKTRLFFRNQLRDARAVVLSDAEGFKAICVQLEAMGAHLKGEQGLGLRRYGEAILQRFSADLDRHDAGAREAWLRHFARSFEMLVQARNDEMHQGASARHATAKAVEVALMIEEVLMQNLPRLEDVMVEGPICAQEWQSLAWVRRIMLANSFSAIPVWRARAGAQGEWAVLHDAGLVRFLKGAPATRGDGQRDALTVAEAADRDPQLLAPAQLRSGEVLISDYLKSEPQWPVLVIHETPGQLRGIVTAYDVL